MLAFVKILKKFDKVFISYWDIKKIYTSKTF